MTTKDAAGGAGSKAFLTVEYEDPDPELHTELFVKMPWDTVGTKETGGDALWRYKVSALMDMEYQECTIYHFMSPILPFKTPKFYFADICRANTNYILITEKILFGGSGEYLEGKKNKSFAPYTILPVAEKYFDFERPPRQRYEMYYAIMRAMARMAAWDHLKKFEAVPASVRGGDKYPQPLLGAFEFPRKMPQKKRQMAGKAAQTLVRLMREFVQDKGKRCFPPELKAEDFMTPLGNAFTDIASYREDLASYQLQFPDQISLFHMNLQSDNAYFWYNDDDEIDCGIIDWGGAGPTTFIQFTLGCLSSCEGDVLVEHELGFLRCFVEEFHRECGLTIDLEHLYRMYLINMCMNIGQYMINVEQEVFREVPREKWDKITCFEEGEVIYHWNCRCYCFMIRIGLKYMYLHRKKHGRFLHHDYFLEWLDYWKAKGLE